MAGAKKSSNAFRTISEVADFMEVPQHVLRFWESKFTQINPMKRGGGRRYYRPEDVEIIEAIRSLLYEDGYTIKGAQKYLKEQGVKTVLQTLNDKTLGKNSSSSSENNSDYERQIQALVQKSSQQIKDDTDIITALKNIRGRLKNISHNLTE